MFRSGCRGPSGYVARLVFSAFVGSCDVHSEDFTGCSNKHVGELHLLLLGEGGVPPIVGNFFVYVFPVSGHISQVLRDL